MKREPPLGEPGGGANFTTRRQPSAPPPKSQDDAELAHAVREALTFALAAGFAVGAAVVLARRLVGVPAMSAMRRQLDVKPSRWQGAVLRRLVDGYQVAFFPDATCRFRETHEAVLWATVQALLRRQWITERAIPCSATRTPARSPSAGAAPPCGDSDHGQANI